MGHAILLKLLVYPLSLLPMRVLYGLADLCYFFVYKLFRYRRDVVVQNTSRSFPEKSYREIKFITKQFYRHFCDLLIEILKYYSIREKTQKQNIRFTNTEALDELYDAGKNVILLLGHYANWEALNVLPKYIKAPVGAVYSPLSNKLSDRLIMQVRTRFGVRMYPMQRIARHILSHRDARTVYLFVADQSPGVQSKYHTTFLHQPTLFFTGAEKLAAATRSAVVYVHFEKTGRGKYTGAIIPVTNDGAQEPEGAITQKYVELLEANIRENNTLWLWTHKRWKNIRQLNIHIDKNETIK
ncbi:MAG: lysophospholipid acyltransferase family protein [Prevotellaceae bacterium]|jgi:KDO2-lipid IV(A) lauroyltransferase|nr:lysophospholipid acyltransferase family protein [Prevotellaceae bacterium]